MNNTNNFVGYITNTGVEFNAQMSSDGKIGPPGPQGIQGEKGDKGDQGIQGIQGIQGPQGVPGQNGVNGQDGYTPVKGVDYFTAADISSIEGDVTTAVLAQAYIKPSGGIPSTDMTNAVQTSLGKADTALQSFTETDPTVPSHVKNITQTNISDWNLKQEGFVTPLDQALQLSDGTAPDLNSGYYFTGPYWVEINGNAFLDQNSYFEVSDYGNMVLIVGNNEISDPTSHVAATYSSGTWEVTKNNYLFNNNIVSSISSSSTNSNVPGAKLLYDQLALKAGTASFTGTDGINAGTKGLVPAPLTTDDGKFLCADGTWQTAGGGGGLVDITQDTNIWELAKGTYSIAVNDGSYIYLFYDSTDNTKKISIQQPSLLVVDTGTTNVYYSLVEGDKMLVAGSIDTLGIFPATMEFVNLSTLQTKTNLVTSISSSSTNTQYPSAKCVYDSLATKTDSNNVVKSFWQGTQAQYDALATKDANTLYITDGHDVGNSYSTSEQVIGTWIDGKPLYRKVGTITFTSTSSNQVQGDLICSDIKYGTIESVFTAADMLSNNMFNSYGSNWQNFVMIDNREGSNSKGKILGYNQRAGLVNMVLYVSVIYTKSTD